jgi:hypothetical protein
MNMLIVIVNNIYEVHTVETLKVTWVRLGLIAEFYYDIIAKEKFLDKIKKRNNKVHH